MDKLLWSAGGTGGGDGGDLQPRSGLKLVVTPHQLTQPLFPEPNIESPLNTHAAELWKNQVGECLKQNPPAPSRVG